MSPARGSVHHVILYKDAIYDDYGFSVSDGLYERGVYINRIRKGGPADIVGLLRPYDRILQVSKKRMYCKSRKFIIRPIKKVKTDSYHIQKTISNPYVNIVKLKKNEFLININLSYLSIRKDIVALLLLFVARLRNSQMSSRDK